MLQVSLDPREVAITAAVSACKAQPPSEACRLRTMPRSQQCFHRSLAGRLPTLPPPLLLRRLKLCLASASQPGAANSWAGDLLVLGVCEDAFEAPAENKEGPAVIKRCGCGGQAAVVGRASSPWLHETGWGFSRGVGQLIP